MKRFLFKKKKFKKKFLIFLIWPEIPVLVYWQEQNVNFLKFSFKTIILVLLQDFQGFLICEYSS